MTTTAIQRRVLVYGGKGALGSVCVDYFRKQNWWVTSIDLHENDQANSNILIDVNSLSLVDQETNVIEQLTQTLGTDDKLDAIICVAGGWAGGTAKNKDFIKNSELMIRQSLWSSLIATKLASKFLKSDGLLTLTGAKAALEPTPGMIGYGMAKSAVHHLVKSLSQKDKSGLPSDSSVLAILPITLDTPMNRKFMPNANFQEWTPLTFVADLFVKWTNIPQERPKSGSLVQLLTENGITTLKID
uniref:Dihydropteridine reductase n=1 Tax=Dermatophagoides pteronyssinus TaxID=6956 RepID=A0A6P6YF37_DERPT|nr:dihydropteridine reductase-like [Dermatophagoides pteronyssinus]